jgi:hypothetical protein
MISAFDGVAIAMTAAAAANNNPREPLLMKYSP